MKFLSTFILATILFFFNTCFAQLETTTYLKKITNHYVSIIDSLDINNNRFPRSLNEDGSIRFVKSKDWTSGFFPGVLWQLYSYSNEDFLKESAIEWTKLLEQEQFNDNNHDIGFRIMCSFGNGYRLTESETYKNVIIESAKTLLSRFDKNIGAIKSWNSGGKPNWNYPVIIDNMMNLELLFKATELTGDSIYFKVAIKHANTTLKNHFRSDFSTYHVVDFDSSTGDIIRKVTHQGYADESAWARGQSWALYGFTMTYRFTKDEKYFDYAKRIASFLMRHPNLPKDFVPYWDYDSPDIPDTYRDVSAAAIMASALYELSKYDNDNKDYVYHADRIIRNINDKYLLKESDKPFYTTSSVGNYNKNSEINVPINYADYYLIEALLRRLEISNDL